MKLKLLATTSVLLLATASSRATVIFSQTFTGVTAGETLLDDTVVTTGTGTWQAGAVFTTSGVMAAARTSAVVNFAPTSGNIYELTATVDLTGTGLLGLGFSDTIAFTGNSGGQNNNNAFRFSNTTNIVGTGWIMLNGAVATDAAIAYSSALVAAGTPGTSLTPIPTGDVALKVILDTNAANWQTTYFVNGTLIGTSSFLGSGNVIDSAGLTSGNGTGTISNIQLQTIPEPGAALLGGIGMLALLRRRRD